MFKALEHCEKLNYSARISLSGVLNIDIGNRDEGAIYGETKAKSIYNCWFYKYK